MSATTALRLGQAFYDDALGVTTKEQLGESLADWVEMDAGEQRFVLAHLLYLGLRSVGGLHAELRGAARSLAELEDVVAELATEPRVAPAPLEAPPTPELPKPSQEDEPSHSVSAAR